MASSDTTRMLVLGVARIFEPANGYQLRRELLSWQVEHWAHVNPGSVYSMLATLTKQGMLDRHELAARDDARPVAVYTTTEAGREELKQLISDGITTITSFDQTGVYAALSLIVGMFTREETLALLEKRAAVAEEWLENSTKLVAEIQSNTGTPPHVASLVGFGSAMESAGLDWLRDFTERVKNGEFEFFGEPGMEKWTPAANDPAWAMVREREAYLKALDK